MKISVIIPNYNGEELLKKNLPKVIAEIKKYKNIEFEIIVVDDASTDNSLSVISNFLRSSSSGQEFSISNFKLVKNENNLGFPKTVNRGVKESTGDVLLLLNTDVIPENNFLTPLLNHFEDEKVFAVGCMDKSIEGENIVLRGRGVGGWKKGFFVHARGEVDKTNTLWVNGGSGAFRKSIWEKLKGFDELYSPFYWEDIDLSYRALKSGYKIFFEPKSIVIHEHEKGSIKRKYKESEVKKIAYRNQFIFIWKNITDKDLILSHLIWLPFYLIKAIINLDLPFVLGLFDAIFLIPKIIFKRLESRGFIQTDDKLLAGFKDEIT